MKNFWHILNVIAMVTLNTVGIAMAGGNFRWINKTVPGEVKRGDRSEVRDYLAGGEAEKKDVSGCTLLLHAAENGYKELVGALLEGGADVTVTTEKEASSCSLLHYVVTNLDWMDIATEVIEKGVDVNVVNSVGFTPLHYVMYAHNMPQESVKNPVKMIRFLLARGANVNARSKRSHTPLHEAVTWDAPQEAIKELLDAGANTQIKDDEGKKPIDVATTDAVRTLLEHYSR